MADEQFNAVPVDAHKEKQQPLDVVILPRFKLDLLGIEQEIIKAAKKLMEKHYLLDIQQLQILSVKSMPDYQPTEISRAIASLLSKKVLFDGKALTRDDVFTNETRKRMFELICYRPGIHFSVIRSLTKKDSRSVLFHLSILERFGFVRFKFINNNKAYYEQSTTDEFDVFDYFFQKDGIKEIFKAVFENPSISYEELRSILGSTASNSPFIQKVKMLLLNDLLSGRIRSNKITTLNIPARFRKRITMLFAFDSIRSEFMQISPRI